MAMPNLANVSAQTGPTARTVEGLHQSATFHWVGNAFHVSTCFPSTHLTTSRVSPFVHMDYGPPRAFTPLGRGRRGGGWHPHRGAETVTLVWEGSIAHHDNAGNTGLIGPGDVQWMTAASGVFHEEYHAEELTRQGGRLHMMQLWVNLPKKYKTESPRYQALAAGDIPIVAADDGSRVRVVAGAHAAVSGPASTFTPITLLDAELKRGGSLVTALPASHNALAVVVKGRIHAGGVAVDGGQVVVFANDGSHLDLRSDAERTHVVVLAGEPIDEPIVQYGSFVMNSVEEIEQAVRDVQEGRFGPQPR